jgi:hypothetical protein
MYIRVYVCMYMLMYVYTYVCIYVCMYVYMYACMYVHIYVCMYVCTYDRTHLIPIIYFPKFPGFYSVCPWLSGLENFNIFCCKRYVSVTLNLPSIWTALLSVILQTPDIRLLSVYRPIRTISIFVMNLLSRNFLVFMSVK